MNKTEAKALDVMVKTGFTFYGDNFFATFTQAKRCLDGLVRKGYAVKIDGEFKATDAGRDFVNHGLTIGWAA